MRPISSSKLGSAGLHSRRKERASHVPVVGGGGQASGDRISGNRGDTTTVLIDNPDSAMRGFVARSTGGS